MHKSNMHDFVLAAIIALLICLCWYPLLTFLNDVVKIPTPDTSAWLPRMREFLLPEPAERFTYFTILFLLSLVGAVNFVRIFFKRGEVNRLDDENLTNSENPSFKIGSSLRTLLLLWCIMVIVIALHLFLFPERYVFNGHCEHHFAIVHYPFIMQSLNMVEINQYGAYFLFLRPWCLLFGCSMISILFCFLGLLFLPVLGLTYVVAIWCRSTKWLLIAFVIALLFVWPAAGCAWVYLQYHPIRTIFPMLALFGWSVILFATTPLIRRIARIIVAMLAGVSVIWNVDSGVVVLVASVFFLGLTSFSSGKIRSLLLEYVILATSFLSTYYVAALMFGNFHWLIDQLSYQKIFYVSGFFMLPIGDFFLGGAALVLFVDAMAFMFGCAQVGRYWRAPASIKFRKGCYYVSAAILALGLFSYYQGRSHGEVLHVVSWVSLFLSVLLTNDGCHMFRQCVNSGQGSFGRFRRKGAEFCFVLAAAAWSWFLFPSLTYHALSGGSVLRMLNMNKKNSVVDVIKELGQIAREHRISHVLAIGERWQNLILDNIGLKPCLGQRCLTEMFFINQEEQLISSLVSLKSHECVVFTREICDDYLCRYPQVERFLTQCKKISRGELIMYIPSSR